LKAKYYTASAPVLPDVTLEPEVETKTSAEPLPTSTEQDLPVSIEHEPVPLDEPAAMAEDLPEIALAPIELQSELKQEIPVLSTASQEKGVDIVSTSKDTPTTFVHEVESGVEAETCGTEALIAATTAADLVAAETEQPVVQTTEVFIFYSRANPFADLPLLERITLLQA
jgi:hypothetical protein